MKSISLQITYRKGKLLKKTHPYIKNTGEKPSVCFDEDSTN